MNIILAECTSWPDAVSGIGIAFAIAWAVVTIIKKI